MNAAASLRTAVRALRKNKLRSLLAMLGIVIAVAAVMATVSIGQGAQAKVAAQMESLGANLLMVLPGSIGLHGVATGTRHPEPHPRRRHGHRTRARGLGGGGRPDQPHQRADRVRRPELVHADPGNYRRLPDGARMAPGRGRGIRTRG